MEHEHHSVNHFSMMHGLYLGLALIMNTLIFYVSGNPFSDFSGLLTYAILIAGIAFAMWTFAKLNTEEGLPYSRALGLGTLVSLFGSLIFAFFTYILYKFIEPGLIEKMLAMMEEKMLAQGYKDELIEKMLGAQKQFITPAIMSFGQVFTVTFLGFLFSLILAIFFKKEPENPFYEVEKDEEGYE
ncbi:MAG TPA: DUF4199 domain-containing protein [Prolixibacteraceae bacterium]|jgi:hypothetical protein|nr:DUF4199 domain-containing protein [Prolixibacteraceae bacterium]